MLGGVFLALPVHAGGLAVVDLHAVHADVALAGAGVAGDDAGEGDEAASVLRPGLEDGSSRRLTSSPRWMTCLQGASFAGMTLGKKLPTSASMGSIFILSMKLVGVCGLRKVRMRLAMSSRESVSRARRMRRSLPNWFMRTRAPGWPFTFSKRRAGPPAFDVPRPSLAVRS